MRTVRPVNLRSPLNPNFGPNADTVLRLQCLPGIEGGRQIFDLSGKGNHGTLTNMATAGTSGWGSTARAGGWGEMRFDGTNDQVVASPLAGQTVAAMTLSAWVCRASASNSMPVGWADTVNSRFYLLPFSDGKVYCVVENDSTSFPSFAFSGTGWHHIAMSFDAGGSPKLRAYLNGVPQTLSGDTSASAYAVTGSFRSGRDASNGIWGTGASDIITVQSRALAAAEIYAKYIDELTMCPDSLSRSDDYFLHLIRSGNRRRRVLCSSGY